MKQLLLLVGALFFSTILFCQDTIYKKGGQIIKAHVLEIGTAEIKYKLPDNPDGPLYAIDRNSVSKIVYANGKEETFVTDIKDPENYVGQLTKAIKIDFFGPLLGYTEISYEKSTGVGKSYELSFGIIGLGKNQHIEYYSYNLQEVKKNQFGFFATAGYKFNKWPDFLFGRTKFRHLMQGAYVKPVLYLGNYSENVIIYKSTSAIETVEKQNVTFGALQLEFGKQWVFGEKFLIDIFWGLGYGADNKYKENTNYYEDNTTAYNYGNVRVGKSPGFSTTFGIKAGLLIK